MEPIKEVDTIGIMPKRAGVVTNRTAARAAASDIVYPIRYTETQVMPVADEVLLRNRILNRHSGAEQKYKYKLLRSLVLTKLRSNGWSSIAMLAARSGAGASLSAINLAVSIAMDTRHTVLLVDLNLRAPSIHHYFGITPEFGFMDIVSGAAGVKDVLINPGIEGLSVLPSIDCHDAPSEILGSPFVADFMTELRERYHSRIIIFDLPPLLESEDAVAFMPCYDAGLLVCRHGVTPAADLATLADLLAGKPLLGSIVNDVK